MYDDDDDDGDGDGDVLLSCSYDSDRDKFLGVDDLAKMMKKIKSSPVELSGLDEMIREVDEDGDGKLSLREVLIVTFGAAVILPDLYVMASFWQPVHYGGKPVILRWQMRMRIGVYPYCVGFEGRIQ